MITYKVGEQMLSLSVISEIIEEDRQLTLSEKAKQKIQDCRDYLDKKMEQSDAPIYGINTGFGSLCNYKISNISTIMNMDTSTKFFGVLKLS